MTSCHKCFHKIKILICDKYQCNFREIRVKFRHENVFVLLRSQTQRVLYRLLPVSQVDRDQDDGPHQQRRPSGGHEKSQQRNLTYQSANQTERVINYKADLFPSPIYCLFLSGTEFKF